MKKKILLLAAMMVFLIGSSANALMLDLPNWKLDLSGGSDPSAKISDLDAVTSTGFNVINESGGGFTQYSVFKTSALNDFTGFTDYNPATFGTELTFELIGSGTITNTLNTLSSTDFTANPTGSFTITNALSFTDVTLNVFLDPSQNYGETIAGGSIFGANDGTQIGSFDFYANDLASWTWTGTYDATGVSLDLDFAVGNGQADLSVIATDLAQGYWFDQDDNDLYESVVGGAGPLVIGAQLRSTNNYPFSPALTAAQIAELGESGLIVVDNTPATFITRSNPAAFDPTVIPEPGTMLLLGFGLMGLAAVSRKRQA